MKKILFFTIVVGMGLLALVIYQYRNFSDGKLHVIFCDVGQGDAALIITPERKHILVDGGPDQSVLTCLSQHMPFWERDIDLMILTHPHADHLLGMHFVLQRYDVRSFAVEDLSNDTRSYQDLLETIEEKHIPLRTVFAGDRWIIEKNISLFIVAPDKAFIERTSPGGRIGESGEFASIIAQLQYKSFSILLTGDSQVSGLEAAATLMGTSIDILHVPHHGSASGMNNVVLKKLAPQMAVISVGAKNTYGHPTTQTMQLLEEQKIGSLRTDKHGEIEIKSDGSIWDVRTHPASN